MDGLIKAFGEPRVILQLCYALTTGTQPFGEEVVRQAKCVLKEVEWRVPEGIAEQESCKCNHTKKESKSPDFPDFEQRHVVDSQILLVGNSESATEKSSITINLESKRCEKKASPLTTWYRWLRCVKTRRQNDIHGCGYFSDNSGFQSKTSLIKSINVTSLQIPFKSTEDKSAVWFFQPGGPRFMSVNPIYWLLRCWLFEVSDCCVIHCLIIHLEGK